MVVKETGKANTSAIGPNSVETGKTLKDTHQLAEKVWKNQGGRFIGPTNSYLHSPELFKGWSKTNDYVLSRTCIPGKLNELAICMTGRYYGADFEVGTGEGNGCVGVGLTIVLWRFPILDRLPLASLKHFQWCKCSVPFRLSFHVKSDLTSKSDSFSQQTRTPSWPKPPVSQNPSSTRSATCRCTPLKARPRQ